jgi:Putative addiction module component
LILSSTLAQITQDALRLPQDQQLRLARTLLEGSEASGQPDVDAAWEEEIERRITNIDAGLAKGRPFAEVVAEIDRQLGR